jgi:hypothetical protein
MHIAIKAIIPVVYSYCYALTKVQSIQQILCVDEIKETSLHAAIASWSEMNISRILTRAAIIPLGLDFEQ